jgi:hypothetical protein
MGPVSTIYSKSRKTVLTTLCLISVATWTQSQNSRSPSHLLFVIGLGSAVSLFDLSTFWRDE